MSTADCKTSQQQSSSRQLPTQIASVQKFGRRPLLLKDRQSLRTLHMQDGNVLTSSGVTAGMDMTLYFIAKLLGSDAAHSAAAYTEYDGQWIDSTADNWSK